MSLKCVVVDDEAIARELLTSYISKIPELELVDSFASPLEAMSHIRSGQVDLLFLDIEMPEITGIDFLKTLEKGPHVILTTAYSEYAIQSYEFGVLDYLLKPIEFTRFYKAVTRALNLINPQKTPAITETPTNPEATSEPKEEHIFVKADNKVLKVEFADIEYVTSKGAYVQIVTASGKKIMTLQSMNRMEEILPGQQFFRVHRSHIVNIGFVEAIEGNTLRLKDDQMISLSKSKKDDFMARIDPGNLLG